MAKKLGPLSPDEVDYIKKNCFNKSDKDIAEYLKRSLPTIKSARKRLGIEKGVDGKMVVASNGPQTINRELNEIQRKEFFREQLINTLYYETLKKQFTKEEIDFYLEEWPALCVQFEDIVATEKRQIDELIKQEIMGNRVLRNIKITEEEISKTQERIEEFRVKNPKMEEDENAQQLDENLNMLVRLFSAQSDAMASVYQKNVDTKNKLLGELNARRKDRIDQIKRSNTTFLGVVEKFRDIKVRQDEGKRAELLRISKDKKKEQWRKPIIFLDGRKDCILLDKDSKNDQEDQDNPYILSKYEGQIGAKILISDPNDETVKKIKKRFPKCEIVKCKTLEDTKAEIEKTEFDLIFLNDKEIGKEAAKFIIERDLSMGTEFIVDSKGLTESNEVASNLSGKRVVDIVDISKIFKE